MKHDFQHICTHSSASRNDTIYRKTLFGLYSIHLINLTEFAVTWQPCFFDWTNECVNYQVKSCILCYDLR